MGSKAGNLIAQTLTTTDGHLGEETLVGLKVESEARVILFNKKARSLLDGFSTYATLRGEEMGIQVISNLVHDQAQEGKAMDGRTIHRQEWWERRLTILVRGPLANQLPAN